MAVTEIKRDDQVSEVLLGNLGAQVNLRGYDGVKKDPTLNTVLSTGNYGLIEQTTHGKHIAVPLAATAVTAAPDATNSVLLVDDVGLAIGVGKYVRLYDAVGVDYAQISSDADGGLVLGGSGANAGRLTLSGDLVVGGNLLWKSGTANTMTFDHAISADRVVTFQDLAGTVALLGAQNAGSLLFVDNTYDIGASGATRPRDLFLARNATVGGTLGVTGTSALGVVSAGAVACSTLHPSGAVTCDTTLDVTAGVVFHSTLNTSGTVTFTGATNVGTLTATGTTVTTLTASSTVQGTRLISTVATGTAPLSVTSTTNVPNLNVEYLNDKHDTAFAQLGASSNFTVAPTINGSTIALIGAAASFTTIAASGNVTLSGSAGLSVPGTTTLNGDVSIAGASALLGYFGAALVARQTVSGSRVSGAALLSLLSVLNTYGLINDTTTA